MGEMPDTEGLIIAKADRMKDCEPTRLTLGENSLVVIRRVEQHHAIFGG